MDPNRFGLSAEPGVARCVGAADVLRPFISAIRFAPARNLRATERSARIVLSGDFIVAFPCRLVAVGRDFRASLICGARTRTE